MTVKWIHSKKGLRLLIIIPLIIILSTGYIVYMAQTLATELEEFCGSENIGSEKQVISDALNSTVKRMTVKFISVTLLFLLCSITITIILSVKTTENLDSPALRLKEEELIDEELIDEELMERDLLEGGLFEDFSQRDEIIEEEEPAVLARSYNKMLEAMQRINELEKDHSIELAAANRQLQKEITERKRAEQEIRHLSSRLISIHEEGRKNLAQDLHDEFGQTLTALHLGAETLWNSMPDELDDQKERIDSLIGLIEQLGDKIRSISSDLRPDLLDDLGLIPTLEWYIKEFSDRKQEIDVTFQAVGFRKRLSSEIELVLYRIFQEGMNNVVKHSKAEQVTVTLTHSHPKVIFILRDDGVGFEQTESTDGIGLLGMRERVVSVNGSIAIVSGKNKGTTVRVEVPVALEDW
ncbi:MAG: hypothetical protein GY795_29925 [Desulfobacterales bacterium]|nr:hypothetical protein [Desulfobacterales bacterium]